MTAIGLNTQRLAKLLSLASSANTAEALVALAKAKDVLAEAGMDFVALGEQLLQQADRAKPSRSWGDDAVRAAKAEQEARPTTYTADDGSVWESKTAYDRTCAERARYEAERRHHAPERAAVLQKYGSEAAALARDAREQALHDAALPWLEGPFVPPPGARSPAGRWHSEMGGWSDSVFRGHPVDGCRAAIEAALPMPRTVREAMEETRYWEGRDAELRHALEIWGDYQLDLPARYRLETVQRLYEYDLPIASVDDLHLRLQLVAADDESDLFDSQRCATDCLDAFERLVLNVGKAGRRKPAATTP